MAASPQAFEGARNRGESRQPRPRLHKVQTMDSPANLRDAVKNRLYWAGESPGTVTQERHYLTALYTPGERVYDVSGIDLIFSKLEIIIEVSVNGYIPMNYIAAVQLIPGLVDFQLYCINTLIFNILNIVETAGFAAVCRELPPGTDETGKRIVKPYKSLNYGKMDTLFGTERQRQ